MASKIKTRSELIASISQPTPTVVDAQEDFKKIYNDFLNYLKNIDFSCLKKPKATKANYKSRNKSTSLNEDIKNLEKYMPKIEEFLIKLSKPEYVQSLNDYQIPDRTNASKLTNEEQISEEYNIRLMYYIKELVESFQVYHNPKIRDYYVNLASLILMQYSNSKPNFGNISVHFRFKSIKGLILKLAKKIILERQIF